MRCFTYLDRGGSSLSRSADGADRDLVERALSRQLHQGPFSTIDIQELGYTKSSARIKRKGFLRMEGDAARDRLGWTFLTNHFHVLACLYRDSELRIRDMADLIGITERATVQILSQLEASGYLTKTRVGRRNHYTVHGELPLRHPLNSGQQVGELLRVVEPEIPHPAARRRLILEQ
jgi:MarR family